MVEKKSCWQKIQLGRGNGCWAEHKSWLHKLAEQNEKGLLMVADKERIDEMVDI